MMTDLETQLQADLKDALRSGDKIRLSTIRQLRSQLQYAKLDAGDSWSEERALAVLAKAAKMRDEAIAQFAQGGRADLVAREREELHVLERYLPRPLTEQELDALIDAAIAETGAVGPRDMGKVMQAVMPKVKGSTDGKVVNARVRERLASLAGG